MDDGGEPGVGAAPAGGQGDLTVLSDPHRIRSDCRLIARAAADGWGLTPAERKAVRARLVEVVETRAVMVTTRIGDEEVQIPDGPTADRNSTAAARVLVTIDALDQADRHHVEGHNQKERHHADDVARGVGEGSKHLTIVLAGADKAKLLEPPP